MEKNPIPAMPDGEDVGAFVEDALSEKDAMEALDSDPAAAAEIDKE